MKNSTLFFIRTRENRKHMKVKVFGLGIFLALMSCSAEKVNLSPTTTLLNANEVSTKSLSKDINNNVDFIKYSSEITNTLSLRNDFANKEVNKTFADLKFNIAEYIYAIREHNTVGKERAYYNYENSYKKIQKQKSKLTPENQEILNRILVNVKTNLNLISSLEPNI